MKVVIAGDTLPTVCNEKYFINGDANYLFGEEILSLFRSSELKILNIEGVFTESNRVIDKIGPSIKASPEAAKGLFPLYLDCVSLANNHSLDFGYDGLSDTIELFNNNGISCVGAGENIRAARKPYIKEIEGFKIGVYACAETEFTIATNTYGGANPFDDLEICDHISELKSKVDYLIVLYHGMKELYRYPAPYVMKRCRKLIDKGANLVLCQHSHCIGCMEKYHNGNILYGQGDFIFCRTENNPYRNNGLLVTVDLPDGFVKYIPVVKTSGRVRLAKSEEKEKILNDFFERSGDISNPAFVEIKYQEFCKNLLQSYDMQCLGKFGWLMKRFHLTRYMPWIFRKQNDLQRLNMFQCEAHRDACITGLRSRVSSKK